VADALENRCLPRICSSNNEDSELNVAGDSGEIPLCSHTSKCVKSKAGQGPEGA